MLLLPLGHCRGRRASRHQLVRRGGRGERKGVVAPSLGKKKKERKSSGPFFPGKKRGPILRRKKARGTMTPWEIRERGEGGLSIEKKRRGSVLLTAVLLVGKKKKTLTLPAGRRKKKKGRRKRQVRN